MKYEVEEVGEDLQLLFERCKYKCVLIFLVVVCENRCILLVLQEVFYEYFQEIIQCVSGEFIFVINRDKFLCQFIMIGDEIFIDVFCGI